MVLVCFGAANSLASPYRLLRCLPAVLYEAGVAITVSLSFAPELVMAIADVREARRLRGRPSGGWPGSRGMAVPVLERALDRSLQLASSMDARGYGRRVAGGPWRHAARRPAATAAGLLLVLAGVYGVLVAGSLPGGGIPFVAVGAVLVGVGLAAGGRRTNRTRYRPDPWRAAGVAGGGVGGRWPGLAWWSRARRCARPAVRASTPARADAAARGRGRDPGRTGCRPGPPRWSARVGPVDPVTAGRPGRRRTAATRRSGPVRRPTPPTRRPREPVA